MSHIRLQFVLGYGLSSRAIAWFSAGHFSHVDAVMPDGSLVGARSDWIHPIGGGAPIPPGVQRRPAGYEHWKERIVMTLPCDELQEQSFIAFNLSQIDKPYDSTAIWGFVSGRDWRQQDSWFCSELQGAAIESTDLWVPLYTPRNKVTPACLATVASAHPGATW